MQSRNHYTELLPIPGLWKRDVADVEFEIKVGIVHPVGVIQITWDRDKFSSRDWA